MYEEPQVGLELFRAHGRTSRQIFPKSVFQICRGDSGSVKVDLQRRRPLEWYGVSGSWSIEKGLAASTAI